MTTWSNSTPVLVTMATLQPLLNPGSMPRIGLPFNGGASNRCLRFLAKTSQEALQAFCFSSARTSLIINGWTETETCKSCTSLLFHTHLALCSNLESPPKWVAFCSHRTGWRSSTCRCRSWRTCCGGSPAPRSSRLKPSSFHPGL